MQRQKYIAVDLEFEILLQKSSMSNCIYISWFLLQIIILFQIIKGLSLKAFFVLSLKESVCRYPLSSNFTAPPESESTFILKFSDVSKDYPRSYQNSLSVRRMWKLLILIADRSCRHRNLLCLYSSPNVLRRLTFSLRMCDSCGVCRGRRINHHLVVCGRQIWNENPPVAMNLILSLPTLR